jgi:hypothetical protein
MLAGIRKANRAETGQAMRAHTLPGASAHAPEI